MLLSAVSVLVVAQSSSEIPEGLMNNPVYIYIYIYICTPDCVRFVCGLKLLQIILRVKHFYTNREICEVLIGDLSLRCRPGGDWANT